MMTQISLNHNLSTITKVNQISKKHQQQNKKIKKKNHKLYSHHLKCRKSNVRISIPKVAPNHHQIAIRSRIIKDQILLQTPYLIPLLENLQMMKETVNPTANLLSRTVAAKIV
jgi:hypothetical protein